MAKRISSLFTSAPPPTDVYYQYEGRRPSTSASPYKNSPLTSNQLHVPKTSRKPITISDYDDYAPPPPVHGRQYTPSREPRFQHAEQPMLYELRHREMSGADSLLPPPLLGGSYARSLSLDRTPPSSPSKSVGSRPSMPTLQQPTPQPTPLRPSTSSTEASIPEKQKKKHWWKRNGKKDEVEMGPKAWIAGHPEILAYDVDGLVNARPAQEMWDNDNGNCYVYLFPRTSGKGPSFKIDSSVIASSFILSRLAYGEAGAPPNHTRTPGRGRGLQDPSTPPLSPKQSADSRSTSSSLRTSSSIRTSSEASELHLFLPIRLSSDVALGSTPPGMNEMAAADDMQTLVDYRNFFAFLCGQSLVATERRSSFFNIFMTISGIMKSFHFSNADASTFGEVANASFEGYIEELGLADVRNSREKIIEGIVLGEHMKSVLLYNEAFTHGAGQPEDIVALENPRTTYISPITKNRLTRASMDLAKRTASVRLILTEFEFPFLFSGIMSSKTTELRKHGVRFDAWKEGFLGMRKFVMAVYRHRYGDWPPKASSKKNTLETSGLNRLVLRDVYHDMSGLYDLLVDRNRLTTRTIDGSDLSAGQDEPSIRGLRAVLSEYDRSSPPVKPPVPFDLPILPTLRTTRNDFGTSDPKKAAKEASKKLKDDELAHVLRASWNHDAFLTPFVDAFRDMERRAAHGCNLSEIEDMRIGQWIFLYVVLQALPMLACDAPGLQWTDHVEYFLCEPPRSGVPWADPNMTGAGKRTWFSIGGQGGNVVSLPSDVVEHGVEGIYHRSHCWQMAEQWSANNPILNEALHEQQNATAGTYSNSSYGFEGGLPVPPGFAGSSRSSSYSGVSKRVSSLGLGLEALTFPRDTSPDHSVSYHMERPLTPQHAVDASKTFDSILGDVSSGKGKRKK